MSFLLFFSFLISLAILKDSSSFLCKFSVRNFDRNT